MTADSRPESIALIDLSYLFKKRWHTVIDNAQLSAAKAVLRDLEKLKEGVGHVIICLDAPPYKRAERFAAYKANRPEMEVEERVQRRWLKEEIKRLGYNTAWCQGYEADDVIATLANAYAEWCQDIRLVTVDKDAAQCLRSNVVQFIPPVGEKDWEVRTAEKAKDKFGVYPQFMPLYQALIGDKSDNVPGVPGVGEVRATHLVTQYLTLEKLAAAVAESSTVWKPAGVGKALAENWNQLVLSLELVTLDTNVPLDLESLLVKREAEPTAPAHNTMDIEMDGYTGNETPMPPAQDSFGANDNEEEEVQEPQAAKNPELLEREYDRERQSNGESDPVRSVPGDKAAAPVPSPRRASTALVQHSKYGMVTSDLQPMDLTAAYTVSEWLHKGGLYSQFKTPAQVFTIIARGKELGIGMTTALAGFHLVEGKPVASADLIRALCERDPSFVYLMPTHLSSTKVVWEGMRRGYPKPVVFEYTIEDARKAGLTRDAGYGKPGNWEKRPQDMLSKTAASKLGRILWPAATLGLYCPEEMGSSQEELEEAA